MIEKISIVLTLILLIGIIVWLFQPVKPPPPIIMDIKKRLEMINPKYGKIPIREGGSSYTDNKSIIYLCLSHPVTKHKYSINVLMYVALHEVGHVISTKYGHGKEWKDNFDSLLKKAIDLGIYDPREKPPDDYCGMD